MDLVLDPIYIVNLLLSLIIMIVGYYAYRLNKSKIPLYIAIGFLGFGITHLLLILGLKDPYEQYLIVIRVFSYCVIIFGLYTNWMDVKTYVSELSGKNKQLEAEIAERKRTEEMLQYSEQKYRMIFENTLISMVIIEDDMTISLVNSGFETLSGYDRSALEHNMKIGELIYAADREKVIKYHEARRKDPDSAPRNYESQLIDKNGRLKNVMITVGMIPDTTKSLASCMDITDRKRAETALRLTQYSVDHSSDIVFWVRPDSRFYYVNEAACRMLGYTKDELLSMCIPDIDLDPKYSRENWPAHWNELKEKRSMTFESKYRTKSGSVLHVEISIDYMQFGDMEYDFAFVRDITKRKMAEEALQEAKSEAELYLDLMGHDISNMNQISMGFLELALESPTIDPKDKALLEKPIDSLKNSAKLIDNVRKLQRGKAEDKKENIIDIGSILEKLTGEYASVPGRQIIVRYTPMQGCLVKANDLIVDAFSNVIGNAVKHSTGPIAIGITLDRVRAGGAECYRVSIEDNGPGIPDGLKSKIFNRIQRGRIRSKGSGIGLHLVKTLVESYGGRIRVEDRVPGDYSKGSRFIIMLPAFEKR